MGQHDHGAIYPYLQQVNAQSGIRTSGWVKREHRAVRPTEVRALDDTGQRFEAVVMQYGVTDDYGTVFDPGCFTASLERRLPRITWHHDWSDPIGRYVDYRDDASGLTLVGEFDDFDAVPRARQASAQLRSGTIDQFSVGFMRDEVRDVEGVTHFARATLDEVALVLVGAVPGTSLIAVRSATGTKRVPETAVIDLAKKVVSGELTNAEAKAALDLLTEEDPLPPAVEPAGPDPEIAAAEAEADALLGELF